MNKMKTSSSICQINHSNLYIPSSEMFDMGGRVISLPSLEIHEYLQQDIRESSIVKKHHSSVDDVSTESVEQHPVSCMIDDNIILGVKETCGYINSSHTSSSSSISDTIHLVQRLTSVYDNQDSQSLLDSDLINAEYISNDITLISGLQPAGEISLTVPSLINKASESLEDVTMSCTPIENTEEYNSTSPCSSSFSPTHKPGVPSKAAAILGAREVFISPSHAAYRRLVDYTHRPANDGQSLLHIDAPFVPTMAHPSLTARPHRQSKPDMKSIETSPEKKLTSRYKIISIGIDDVKDKLNFLKRPGELTGGSEVNAIKVTKSKDADKLLKAPGASLKQIRKWSNSFEELLHDRYGLALFHEYLKSEYSEENIEFWIACEEYRAIVNPKKMAIRAHKIIKDFVATQASKEINLDSKTRQLTLENIHHPNTKMFEMAQKRIQTLMEIDSYQRFLRSGMYQSLLQECITTSTRATNENATGMHTDRSANNSIDIPDQDSVQSLRDFRPSGSQRNTVKQGGYSSAIIRISSVKTTRTDTSSSELAIPPSNSEHCLKNATS